ncbi:MAG: SH3 domain-containing protein [Lachnospiraceae bacterium]|nr:SH3 domain-containing protein [Lachnospiraceae bacterium]
MKIVKRYVPYFIILVMILAVGGKIYKDRLWEKYVPDEEIADYEEIYGLSEDEYLVVYNNTIMRNDKAILYDDVVYFSLDFVREQLNDKFYWDEEDEAVLFTTPTEIIKFIPEKHAYTIRSWSGASTGDEGYIVLRLFGEKYYIAAAYVIDHTHLEYTRYDSPRHIVIRDTWGEVQRAEITEDTAVRYQGASKSDVLAMAESGDTVTYLEGTDEWTRVVTDEGIIGWVESSDISELTAYTLEEPESDLPKYTGIVKDYRISMAWHQVMYYGANDEIEDYLYSAPGLNTIAPTWFSFEDTDGDIRDIGSSSYVSTCHSYGVEVWALFSNEFENDEGTLVFDSDRTAKLLASSSSRQNAIAQLMNYAEEYDLDGINLDFEYIYEDTAEDYIQFIRELSVACRYYGLVLSIDNYVPEYSYYYNRTAQSEVADYIVIMGYDEYNASSSEPGPVASSHFVEKGIKDTLEEVPAYKIINGIPFFTRVWSQYDDGSLESFTCDMEDAVAYLTNNGVTPEYLEDYGLNFGTYRRSGSVDEEGNETGGYTVKIWLQDSRAVAEEMKLINKYDIAGVCAWRIGLESGSDIWEQISDALAEGTTAWPETSETESED